MVQCLCFFPFSVVCFMFVFLLKILFNFEYFIKKLVWNVSGKSEGHSVHGIGLSSSNYVTDLSILYRFLDLFLLSFIVDNKGVLEWYRCFLYIGFISFYSRWYCDCLDLIHLFLTVIHWILSFFNLYQTKSCGFFFLSWKLLVHVCPLSFL